MTLRLRYVAGVSPAKWLRAWSERRPDLPLEAARVEQPEQLAEVLAGDADLAFVRLPVEAEGLHRIPLWEEVAVAVLPKDHPLADAAELTLADLEHEPAAPVQPDPAMTVELVAAGTGYAILPHSLARLHHRRDVAAVPVTDAAPTRIALVWRVERDDADIQEFVGVVRGRTTRSSRGDAGDAGDGDATGSSAGTPKASSATGSTKASAKGGAGRAGGKGRGARRAASARSGRTARKRGGRGR
ncbi:LysR family transcriptional regulator substrate-binding protein [Agromyces mariniharenae]|uniref:LysR family transcriptional regulator substrate-binding protein n=1 Tax=Agromyces mariniharenae TaxID=2604423 RepID=UPI001652D771|nr:LysR family transcriptional regulator substrate-binding protein [Agromyces mariniharenae]